MDCFPSKDNLIKSGRLRVYMKVKLMKRLLSGFPVGSQLPRTD